MLKRLLLVTLIPCSLNAQALLTAPNKNATPVNQRLAYGNACGPASLLNAFQYGSDNWRKVFDAIPGKDHRYRIRYVVAAWGNEPSNHIKGAKRWNRKEGINLLDLTDMANEMRKPYFLPKIKNEILTKKNRGTYTSLMKRSHTLMARSLKKGFPPIINIRRYAYRNSKEVGKKSWWPIRAHFVVVTEIPKKLSYPYGFYKIKYIDPYGGFIREGQIQVYTGDFKNSPFLIANMPDALVGKSLVKKNEPTILTLSAIIGSW